MKGLCLYVDGGKGHYIPAKAVQDELKTMGVDCQIEEFFDYLDIQWLGRINKRFWRTMLKMPNLEQKISKHNDADSNGMSYAIKFVNKHCSRTLESNMQESPFDFVFATHPYASTIISEMLVYMGYDIPVFYFATDVFSAPVAAICNKIRKFFISTAEGAEYVKNLGQDEKTIKICPFPIQSSIAKTERLPKDKARLMLGLNPNKFTVQLNLGGEGIGSLKVLENLISSNFPLQIVIIGGIDKRMKKKLEKISSKTNRDVDIYIKGFIKDVGIYLDASDVVVGRAGINTIVEAIYVHRPFIITELVYTVIPSADYVEKYHVGWNCANDFDKASKKILELAQDISLIEKLECNFNNIPIEFGAKNLAKMIVSYI